MSHAAEATKTVIRIGHPAYNGANAMKYCFSKAEAVRELRSRGIKRDVARAKVNKVCDVPRNAGYEIVSARMFGDPIEIGNYTGDYYPF